MWQRGCGQTRWPAELHYYSHNYFALLTFLSHNPEAFVRVCVCVLIGEGVPQDETLRASLLQHHVVSSFC